MNGHAADSEKFVLEVIACSVEDAVNAERGGADRLEVIRDFEHGGYTPPLEIVREIKNAVRLPLRVMLRDEPGYGLAGNISGEKLCSMANELNKMRIDGVVLGFLRSGEVDIGMTRKILEYAPDLKATFHHAFENTNDKIAAIEGIKQIVQVDRILSHGGDDSSPERIRNLDEYASAAHPEIKILAGGRVDEPMIGRIKKQTDIREFHVGSAARIDGKVSVNRVQALSGAVRGLYV